MRLNAVAVATVLAAVGITVVESSVAPAATVAVVVNVVDAVVVVWNHC